MVYYDLDREVSLLAESSKEDDVGFSSPPLGSFATLQFKIHIYSILCRLSKFSVTFFFFLHHVCPSWRDNSKYIPKCLAKHLNGLHQPLWKISRFRPGGICGVKRWTMKEILAHWEARGAQWQFRVWIVNQGCHLLVNLGGGEDLSSLPTPLGLVIRVLYCFPKIWREIRLLRHLF